MLINKKEVERFHAIIHDVKTRQIPANIAPAVLLAFFVENPHLLMTSRFDEHMQRPVVNENSEFVINHSWPEQSKVAYRDLNLPLLEFRIPSGRWAAMIGLPFYDEVLDDEDDLNSAEFLFSFGIRWALRQFSGTAIDNATHGVSEDFDLNEFVNENVLAVSLESFSEDLETRVREPRSEISLLWTPKLWTPKEQTRQRVLLDSSLRPHFERWKSSGICFEDLNPSEFEDLVGEVLFRAGLKIFKVRQTPQGGRDLIARGSLIPDEEPIELAIEVKHRRSVDRPEVQLALYQNRAYPALLFVTSGRFTAGVFKEKLREENRFRLFLKDGLAIGDLVREHFRLNDRTRSSLMRYP